MSLSMLVGGAECGPSNPLQGLSKQFDHDRGLQQDHFGAGRAGSSKEGFRTQYSGSSGADQEAARFFSSNQATPPPLAGPSAYDLSALHTSLPPFHHAQLSVQSPPVVGAAPAPAGWASDFMQLQSPSANSPVQQELGGQRHGLATPNATLVSPPQGSMQWAQSPLSFASRMHSAAYQPYAVPQQSPHVPKTVDESQWNEAFMSHEELNVTDYAPAVQEAAPATVDDPDELARAAGLVIDAVRHEQNPKFQNSQFLGLMKQLRDRDVVVEGGKMIPKEEASGWASDFQQSMDVKGKGKAVNFLPSTGLRTSDPSAANFEQVASTREAQENVNKDPELLSAEEEIDAYFRQDNDEYINFWHSPASMTTTQQRDGSAAGGAFSQWTQDADEGRTVLTKEWDTLQRDWDRFEATATGMRTISNYQFQSHNPYLLGEASTRNHLMHNDLGSFFESVLEMEAAVQRDPTNASAWFELGVKQQENEREQKAIHALRRALELDPTYLPAWLALAISHTNDGNRIGAYEAVQDWIQRNDRYRTAVETYQATHVLSGDASQSERFDHLIDCLISMARSDNSGEIDADIQVALAILMNTNEAYDKATDCFKTALAVRPEDWQLYNRVGATLANSGLPEEALQYYYRALELNPAYIRARFNLGISCINLRRYQEASQHILDALVLQDADNVRDPDGTQDKRGVVSSALWESMKTCCLHMQRIDLATICDRQDLDAFRFNYQIQ